MSEVENNNNSLERLSHLIEQKTSENEALRKLLDELNKETALKSHSSSKKK